MCAAIVQMYHIYYLDYSVLRFSSNCFAAYFDYCDALTQIICSLAAPKQLVAATASCRHLPLPVACHTSRDNVGAPSEPANVGPSIPPPSNPRSIQSICSIHTVTSQFLPLYHQVYKNPISLSKMEETDTIQCLLWRKPPNKHPIIQPMKKIHPKPAQDTPTY